MEKNDNIEYWVERFATLYRETFNPENQDEFGEKAGILFQEMAQNFDRDELEIIDCVIQGRLEREHKKIMEKK